MEENFVSSVSPAKRSKVEHYFGFDYAIKMLSEGKCVTKKEWDNPEYFLQMRLGRLQIHKPDGLFYDLIVTDGDIMGNDWYNL